MHMRKLDNKHKDNNVEILLIIKHPATVRTHKSTEHIYLK